MLVIRCAGLLIYPSHAVDELISLEYALETTEGLE